jgi:predicted metal-dependent peptidase
VLGSRLSDPFNTVTPALLATLNEKISTCMTRMYRLPSNGGNPFLFALTQAKPHELRDELPGMPKDDMGIPTFQTAATDGRKFYWSPKFLEKLINDEVSVVMMHESYHIVFLHPTRGRGFNKNIFNWMIDYVVNGCIEHDHQVTQRKGTLWGGNLGLPLTMQELLDYIDGKVEMPKGKNRCYADPAMHGKSPEAMYADVVDHWEKSPRKCKECSALTLDPKTKKSKIPKPWAPDSCVACGARSGDEGGMGFSPDLPNSTDAHIDAALNRDQVMLETERAAQTAKAMRGSVPAEIEEALGELAHPTLSMHDLIRNARFRRIQSTGLQNNWARLRRRSLAMNPRMFVPQRQGHAARWLALLDTSGSMSDSDMAYGVSQLQVAGNESEGIIIPVDGAPHWEAATMVKNIADLKRTRVVGRGGTVFEQFFAEFPDRLGIDFDAIIILTDGDCGTIPLQLQPPIDVVWVLTRHLDRFEPTFGRVAPLRHERM